ncbi:MAG: enoyl-CoA hydratase-related protein [Steroidobacteraceae bacterium]
MLGITRAAGGLVTLTLDRPDERNALNAELVGRLTTALAELAGDASVRVVLLTGAGKVFCAGADIGEMRAAGRATPDQNEADSRRFATLLARLESQPQPTVAVVNGAAYGGALGLVSACDIALAAQSARFALSEVRLGLVPAMISPYVLRAIGERQAHRWILTGEAMDAATALRIGLVHEVVEDKSLVRSVQKLADELLAGGPEALVEAKKLLRRATGRSSAVDESMLTDTARWIARVRAGDEAAEGLAAFLDKRPAKWRDPGR